MFYYLLYGASGSGKTFYTIGKPEINGVLSDIIDTITNSTISEITEIRATELLPYSNKEIFSKLKLTSL